MTLLESLTAALQVPSIDSDTLEKACIDVDLVPSATYTKANATEVDTAALNVLNTILVSSESEGGYSYNISSDLLKKRITALETKLGLPNSLQPKVKVAHVW